MVHNKTQRQVKLRQQQHVADTGSIQKAATGRQEQLQQQIAHRNNNNVRREHQQLSVSKRQQHRKQQQQQKQEQDQQKYLATITSNTQYQTNNNNSNTTKSQQQQQHQQSSNHRPQYNSYNKNNYIERRNSVKSNDCYNMEENHKFVAEFENNHKLTTNKSQTEQQQIQSHILSAMQRQQQQIHNPENSENIPTLSNSSRSYAQALGSTRPLQRKSSINNNAINSDWNDNKPSSAEKSKPNTTTYRSKSTSPLPSNNKNQTYNVPNSADARTSALVKSCVKCLKPTVFTRFESHSICGMYVALEPNNLEKYIKSTSKNKKGYGKQYYKSKSYGDSLRRSSVSEMSSRSNKSSGRLKYYRSYSDRRDSLDRHFVERNSHFATIEPPVTPILAASNINAVIVDTEKIVIVKRLGKGRTKYPIMQVKNTEQ